MGRAFRLGDMTKLVALWCLKYVYIQAEITIPILSQCSCLNRNSALLVDILFEC